MDQGLNQPPNPADDQERHRLILRLITHLKCVGCGQSYNAEDFAVIHRQKNLWILRARCQHCHSLCHVVVLVEALPADQPAVDRIQEESQRPEPRRPITTDDVLDVHTLLAEFDGDFQSLFTG